MASRNFKRVLIREGTFTSTFYAVCPRTFPGNASSWKRLNKQRQRKVTQPPYDQHKPLTSQMDMVLPTASATPRQERTTSLRSMTFPFPYSSRITAPSSYVRFEAVVSGPVVIGYPTGSTTRSMRHSSLSLPSVPKSLPEGKTGATGKTILLGPFPSNPMR